MLVAAGVMAVPALALERERHDQLGRRFRLGAALSGSIVGSAVTFSIYFWLLSHACRPSGWR